MVCLQETKAQEDQLTDPMFRPDGHHCFYRDATTKKGYSGVAIYSRSEPDEVCTKLGWAPFDDEGRYIEARFGKLSVVSLYVPSGSSGEERQQFKFKAMDWLAPILRQVAAQRSRLRDLRRLEHRAHAQRHQELDSNQKNSGCLPQERAWLNGQIADACGDETPAPKNGWVDSFRVAKPDAVEYTWWSNRGAARANNVGWRIDYQIVHAVARARDQGVLDHAVAAVFRSCAVHGGLRRERNSAAPAATSFVRRAFAQPAAWTLLVFWFRRACRSRCRGAICRPGSQ